MDAQRKPGGPLARARTLPQSCPVPEQAPGRPSRTVTSPVGYRYAWRLLTPSRPCQTSLSTILPPPNHRSCSLFLSPAPPVISILSLHHC